MKKRLVFLTIISASYATVAPAQDQNYYGGLGIGRSSANVTEISRQGVLDSGFNSLSAFQNGSSKSDTAWKIYGGYRFSPNIAGEFFYTNLGKFSRDASGSGVTASSATVNFSLSSDLEITGFGAAALLGAPLSEQWNVFAKPGLLVWDAKRTSTTTVAGATQSGSVSKSGTSPSLGVGTSYAFTDQLSARLEWERYFDVGDKNTTDKSSVNLFALSVQFTP
jgi:OOP family OmpA-OmpF porin